MARQRPTRIPTPACLTQGRPRVEVQYQLEVNRLKGNFGWVWPMWAGHPKIDRAPGLVIGPCIYQLEVNRCRNEEVIVKGIFWVGLAYVGGAPQVEIDRIVMHKFQYQFEVNRLKGNFGWVWSMWAGRPRVGIGAMHKVQYQFEVFFKRCRNEEVNFQDSNSGRDGQIDRQTDRRTAEITKISQRF
ncbi:hypothetical protein DPMN_119053 [Dreissena polymorpha]|uniref:Uncharacterized protein n=1 Tax=Dreissena polymorpha TaxID=45954 RepID=A0A9D4GLS8_DREPO|nr:hypothetical protein DPMN_119053 [Dreissena polymorpha]